MVDKNSLNLELIDTKKPAQDWARIINENFTKIDYHNHVIYMGAPVSSEDLSSGTLNVNFKRIVGLNWLNFTPNDIFDHDSSLFVNSLNDLYYVNDLGTTTQITIGNLLNTGDIPEGFTVVGTDPVAMYFSASNTIAFFDNNSANLAKIICESADLKDFVCNTVSIDEITTDATIVVNSFRNELCGVEAPSTFKTFSSSYESFTPASVFKVSESGAFYYDDGISSYDLSYFKGAKELVISSSSERKQKTGLGYSLETIDFVTEKTITETFTVIPSLGSRKLVNICPIFKTTGSPMVDDNFKSDAFTMPVFRFLFNEDSVQVFCSWDFSALPIDTVVLSFKIIYADENITFGDL